MNAIVAETELTVGDLVRESDGIPRVMSMIGGLLASLRTTSDLTKRIRLKAKIALLRDRLASLLMLVDREDPFVYRTGDKVFAVHPRLLFSGQSGPVYGEVMEFRANLYVGITDSLTGRLFLFHPRYVRHDIPHTISSHSFWP